VGGVTRAQASGSLEHVPVVHLDHVDSTNTEAMRRIAIGVTEPLWIRADQQTAGKGRAGRRWVSETGNFYGSLVLPLDVPRQAVSQLSLVVGVAVVDALVSVAGAIPGLRLKWPNDLLVGTGKLAGILPESTTTRDGRLVVVLGIGINLLNPPANVGRPVAGLTSGLTSGQTSGHIDPAAMIAPLSHWLSHWISIWSGGENFRAVREAWLARAGDLGEAINVNTGAGPVGGTYCGLDDDGALLMQLPNSVVRRVTFGDVMLAGEG
jgi:BirA family transcriptional regulator, biotin operon repressor / biotin---[acetyl-CoA-carboxylase] ligase